MPLENQTFNEIYVSRTAVQPTMHIARTHTHTHKWYFHKRTNICNKWSNFKQNLSQQGSCTGTTNHACVLGTKTNVCLIFHPPFPKQQSSAIFWRGALHIICQRICKLGLSDSGILPDYSFWKKIYIMVAVKISLHAHMWRRHPYNGWESNPPSSPQHYLFMFFPEFLKISHIHVPSLVYMFNLCTYFMISKQNVVFI